MRSTVMMNGAKQYAASEIISTVFFSLSLSFQKKTIPRIVNILSFYGRKQFSSFMDNVRVINIHNLLAFILLS